MQHLPMIITYLRMLTAFYFLWIISMGPTSIIEPYSFISAIVFIAAALTDWLDGFLSRKLNCESLEGQLMDPIADKILVTSALLALLNLNLIDPYLFFILISRDLFIGGVRSIAAAENLIIAAKPLGKLKTALQMLCIPFMFWQPFSLLQLKTWAYYGLWLSVVLSLISGAQYSWIYFSNKSRRAS